MSGAELLCMCGDSACPRCYPYRAALIQPDDRDDVADYARDLRLEQDWDKEH